MLNCSIKSYAKKFVSILLKMESYMETTFLKNRKKVTGVVVLSNGWQILSPANIR